MEERKSTKAKTYVRKTKHTDLISSHKPQIEIIGREKEQLELQKYIHVTARGRGHFILVNGEAGVGKSYYISTMASQAEASGFRSLELDFQSYPRYKPYAPFMDLIKSLTPENTKIKHLESYIDVLTKGHSFSRGVTKSYDTESIENLKLGRATMQQRLLTALIEAAKAQPLYLFIKNLYLASQTSMQFIHYLAGKIHDEKILVITSLRQDGHETHLDKVPVYADVLQRMNREGLLRKIHLNRLDRGHIRRYLSKRFKKSDFTSTFVNLIYKISNGLPSRFVHYINVLQEEGHIFLKDEIWYNSESLKTEDALDLVVDKISVKGIAGQLQLLDENKVALLKYTSLINDCFDHRLMSVLTNRTNIAVLRDLEFLRNNKFLISLDETNFEIRNTTIRLGIAKTISKMDAVRMHSEIADVVEDINSISEDRKIHLLGQHSEASGNKEKAFEYLFIAGRSALQNLAFTEASELFRRAVKILDSGAINVADEPVADLLISSAWVNRLIGNFEDSRYFCERAEKLIDKTNLEKYSNLLLQKGLTYFRLRNWKKSINSLEECLKYENELNTVTKAYTLYGLASVQFELGNYQISQKYFERALLEVKRVKNRSFEADILNNLGAIESVTGKSMKAIARFSQCIPLYKELGDNYGLAQLYNNLGLTYADSKNWEEANRCYGQSLSICDVMGNTPLKSIVFLNRVYALIQLGDIELANEYNKKSLVLSERMNDQLGIAEYKKNWGVISRKRENLDQAEKMLNEALKSFNSYENKLGVAETTYELGLLAYDKSDLKKFNKCFSEAIECYQEIGLNQRASNLVKDLEHFSEN